MFKIRTNLGEIKNQVIGKDEKMLILSEAEEHGANSACRKYDASASLFYRWKRQFNRKGIDVPQGHCHRGARQLLILVLLTMLLSGCSFDRQARTSHFTLVKTGPLIAPPASMSIDNFTIGAYYPTLVKMDGVENFPYDYALYFSTDHASDMGGIWLYLCNGIPGRQGSWISYDDALAAGSFDYLHKKPAGNPVYVDTVRGTQTETPHANVIEGSVYLSYHNYFDDQGMQGTMMALSEDGINFERIADDDSAIILKPQDFLDHTGYFRWGPNPFSGVDYQYVGYSLRRGSINFLSSVWGSNDAIQWDELQTINSWRTDQGIPGDDLYLIWHEMDPASIRDIGNGEYVAICCVGNKAAGRMARFTELYEVFLAADGCTQTRMARRIIGVGDEASYDAEECSSSALTTIGDSLYMVYVGTSGEGKINTVMGAVGVFHAHAEKTPELTDSLRQYHFFSSEEYKNDLMNNKNR